MQWLRPIASSSRLQSPRRGSAILRIGFRQRRRSHHDVDRNSLASGASEARIILARSALRYGWQAAARNVFADQAIIGDRYYLN
jgi:hypothetical protein